MTHDHAPAKADAHLMAAKAADSDTDIPESTPIGAYADVDAATITHAELTELILTAKGWRAKKSARYNFCSSVSTWCKALGLTKGDAAHRSLGQGFEGRLTAVTDNLAERSKHTARNVRWAARCLKQTYESIRTHGSLPLDFQGALKQAVEARGWMAKHLIAALNERTGTHTHDSIHRYLAGTSAPVYPRSIPLVIQIEKVLELPENTLVSRAFRRPKIIRLGNNNPIAYRAGQSKRVKSVYALKELPPQFEDFWRELADWRAQPKLRVDGTTHIPKGHPWKRDGSQKKYEDNLRRFMGWLNLPKPTTSLSALTAEKRWKVGKGVDVKKIRLSHVFNIDLIWEFFDFLLSRQHNHAYTQDHLHYVIFLNSLVNHEYSFVRAHPELSTLFGMKPMSRPKWIKFSEKIHQQLLQLCRDLRALKPVKQRSSDEPLIEIFEDDDPTAIFFEMLEDLTARVPAKAHPLSRSVHLRDIALFHLAMEQPLRARNLSELRLGSTLIRDAQSGKWRVLVAKKALKNHYSKHAQAIYQVLSEPASSAIDRYVEEGRPNLQFSKMTDLFLLSGPSGPKRKPSQLDADVPECFGVPPKGVYWIVRRRTEEAFGLGSGPNVFRHLLATSMLKDHPGDYKGPAAKLSNSPAMIEANYDHLTHKDHLGRADKWYAEKQRKHAETRAKKPRRG